jgi:hypothetical protein
MARVTANRSWIYLLVLSMLCGQAESAAQPGSEVDLESIISISESPLRFDALLKSLTSQTGVRFSYNANKISAGKKMALKAGRHSMAAILGYIKNITGNNYKIVGAHIIFLETKPGATKTPIRSNENNGAGNANKRGVGNISTHRAAIKNGVLPGQKTQVHANIAAGKIINTSVQPAGVNSNFLPDSVILSSLTSGLDDSLFLNKNLFETKSHQFRIDDPFSVPLARDKKIVNQSGQQKRRSGYDRNTGFRTLVKIDLGLQGLGFTIEPRVLKRMTADISAGVGPAYAISKYFEVEHRFSPTAPAYYFSFTPKYYYNLEKRINKNKRPDNNAGNYIGLRVKYIRGGFYSDVVSRFLLLNFHWGIQRPIGNRVLVNMHLGAGYDADITNYDVSYTYGAFYPAVDIKFSYIIAGKKRI